MKGKMRGKRQISLAMALMTILGSSQPIFAFTPAKEDTKPVSYTHLTLPTICSV